MEARNFITAREMLTHNNWIFTTMNELPRYEKPPLPTWLTAISAWLFGIQNLFAYRLPAALSALMLVLIFYKLQLKLNIHRSLAFGASIILMTSFFIITLGREGQWDIFTHSFMMGCCYFFVLMFTSAKHQRSYAIIAGLLFGASLLSKGPVSLYALFIPFLISYSVIYKIKEPGTKWKLLAIFIGIGLIIGTWWTILIHHFDAQAFNEIAEQESGRWFNYNVRPIWYYWNFFIQSGIWTIPAMIGLFYPYLKSRVSNLKAYQFYLLWTLITVVLLSIIPEKKSRYLLPAIIPLAVTTAFYVEYVIKNFKLKFTRLEKFPIYFNFILLTIIALAIPFIFYYTLGEELWEMRTLFILFSIFFILLGFGYIYALLKTRIKLLFALQATMMLLIIILGFPFLKLISPAHNSPNVADLKAYKTTENIQIYDVSGTLPELIWAFGEPIPLIDTEKEIDPQVGTEFGILVSEEASPDWKDVFKNYRLKYVDEYNLNPGISKIENSRLIRSFYIATKNIY
ncbi:MAG TPA: glycosyltransferase family 39 protein [Gillisia sp.]|nr:glycosyltransferase family 39 protein [Gillisia sp.]